MQRDSLTAEDFAEIFDSKAFCLISRFPNTELKMRNIEFRFLWFK